MKEDVRFADITGDVMKKIITHDGTAHLDDFISCCLVLHKDREVRLIERRDPTLEEVEEETIYKLDIGMHFNPQKRQYDHHQTEMNDCALSLLLKSWGLWEDALSVHEWLRVVLAVDTGGRQKVLEKEGLTPSVFFLFHSFIEDCVLKMFQKQKVIAKGDLLFSI